MYLVFGSGEFGYDYAVDLAPAGDFNGDGRRDLLVSGGNITSASNPFPARSFVVFGGSRGLVDLGRLGANGFRIHGGSPRAQSVGGTDFNGDGFDDVVVRSDALVYVIFGTGLGMPFLRGDCNADGAIDVTDPVANLAFQFLGTFEAPCHDACDFNDSGALDISDPIANLTRQFIGGPPPPAPGETGCGVDPTEDGLGCARFAGCPGG